MLPVGAPPTDAEMTNDPESYRGYDVLNAHFPPSPDYVNELVVVRSSTLTVADPAFRAKVESLARAIERICSRRISGSVGLSDDWPGS